jgi:hypothetical protein
MNVREELAIIKSWTPHFAIEELYGEFVTHCPAVGYVTMRDWSLTYDQAIGAAYLLVRARIKSICGMIEEGKK